MDYEFKTTFWFDFSIAECFGLKAIEDTFNRAFKEWKDDVIYLTELVLVLNWKVCKLYESQPVLAEKYFELWSKADNYAIENLKDKDLDYFLTTTD